MKGNKALKLPYAPLTKELPHWHLTPDGIMFVHGGLLEFAIRFSLPGNFFASPEQVDRLSQRLMLLFRNEAPYNQRTRIHLEVSRSPSTIPAYFLDAIERAPENSFPRFLAESRLRHFRAKLEAGELRTWNLFILQTLAPPRGVQPNQPYSRKEYEEALEHARGLRNTYLGYLEEMDLQPEPVGFDGFFTLAFEHLNPDLAGSPTYDVALGTIREQLARSRVLNRLNDRIRVGRTWIAGVTYALSPSELTLGGMLNFIPHVGTASLVVDLVHRSPLQINTALDLEHERIHKLNELVRSPANNAKVREVAEALERMAQNGEHAFSANMLVLLKDTDHNRLLETRREVKAQVALASGGSAHDQHGFFFPWWLASTPGSGQQLPVLHNMLDGDARYFLPVHSPWQGSPKPIYLVETPERTLAGLNPFDGRSKNANGFVLGGSGSGKSYLTQGLVTSALLDGALVVIVEKGAGYEPMVRSMGGSIITLEPTPDNPSSINPFDLPPGQTEPDPDKRARLVQIIRAMLGDTGRNPAIETALIQAALDRVYLQAVDNVFDPERGEVRKEFRPPRLTDFVDSLRKLQNSSSGDPLSEEQQEEARKMALELDGWIGKSTYASIVDRPTTVTLDNDLVYFNVMSLASYPELLRVGVLLISEVIWQQVLHNEGRNKFIVFDEVWALLKHDASRSFIEGLFRTLRKHGGGALAVTQSLQEIRDAMSGVLTSVSHYYLFQMTGEERLAQEALGYPDAVFEAHKNVATSPGRYAELLYLQHTDEGYHGSVVRVPPVPEEYWLYTTSPADQDTLRLYTRLHGGDLRAAIQHVIADDVRPAHPLPENQRRHIEAQVARVEEGIHA